MKILIAFYSRTQTTRKVAEEIAASLSADLMEIKAPSLQDKGFFAYIKAGKQALKKDLPEIEELDKDLENYDLIVIGTPIWAGTVASPVRTFITKEKKKIKKVAFFCSCHDRQARAFHEMKKVLEIEPEAALEVKTGDIKRGLHIEKIKEFSELLKRNQ